MRITIPEKIRRVEGKTAFVESRRLVSMTLARSIGITIPLINKRVVFRFNTLTKITVQGGMKGSL